MPSQAAPLRVLFVDVQLRLNPETRIPLELQNCQYISWPKLLASAEVAEELVQIAVSYCEMTINLYSILFMHMSFISPLFLYIYF